MEANDLVRLRKYKDAFVGKRCFVLGNGPSLNKTNLSLLKNEVIFGVNGLYTGMGRFKIIPTYYGVTDCRFLSDKRHVIGVFSLPPSVTIFLSLSATSWYKKNKNHLMNEIHNINEPICLDWVSDGRKDIFSTNVELGTGIGYTVICDLCLQVSYYMGFNKVYLLGCDSDFTETKHFDANYSFIGGGHMGNDVEMRQFIFPSYKKAKVAFEKVGRKIINCTVGGKLEEFPRQSLEEVMAGR